MPFASKKQARWAHSPEGLKALGGEDKVAERDQATDFSQIPEKKSGALSQAAIKRGQSKFEKRAGALGARFRAKETA